MSTKQNISVLIAGCGDIGVAFSERVKHAFTVYGLRRSTPDSTPNITWIKGDLSQPNTLTDLPAVDYIIYTATPDHRSEDAYYSTYVNGLKNCVDSVELNSVKRLFFISSTSVFGQKDGAWVSESSPTIPDRFTGKTLLTAERYLTDHSIKSTIIRFSGIYGPGRNRLIQKVKQGNATIRKKTPYYTNRIHRDDCVGIIIHFITLNEQLNEQDSPLLPCYIATDCEPAPECEVLNWLADKLDVKRPKVNDSLKDKSMNKRCDNSRLLRSGYEFIHPTYISGYTALLSDYSDAE